MHEGDRNPKLELTYDQLALIHKSLQAVRALGVLPPRDELLVVPEILADAHPDELLDDTMLAIDQALNAAVHRRWAA